MGNYEQLKEAIKAVIKTNGKQEITGQVMQDTLLAITSSFGQGALFAGIATPETNPLTPDQNVFYLASKSGVYPNFNGLSVADGEIVVFSLSAGQWVKQLLSLGGGGSVTIVNEPDEEDLTTVPATAEKNVIRFKNRLYDEANASGKGYKILRKYWKEVNGVRKNILTQDMINDANTIYEIRYDFDLNGAEIQIKEGCVLNFVGGSLSNGKVIGNSSVIISEPIIIFNNIVIDGAWLIPNIYQSWFDFSSLANADNRNNFKNLIQLTNADITNNVFFNDGIYYTKVYDKEDKSEESLFLLNSNTNLYLNDCVIKTIPFKWTYKNIVLIKEANNINIYGGHLIGDADSHDYDETISETHEYSHGIKIKTNSKNITINNTLIEKFTGDGIDLVESGENEIDNIQIINVTCDANNRQGISIESGKNIYIKKSKFTNTSSIHETAPSAGLDIEPWIKGVYVENIYIEDCIFENNKGGIIIQPNHLEEDPVLYENNICIKNSKLDNSIALYACNAVKLENIKNNINYFKITKGKNIQINEATINKLETYLGVIGLLLQNVHIAEICRIDNDAKNDNFSFLNSNINAIHVDSMKNFDIEYSSIESLSQFGVILNCVVKNSDLTVVFMNGTYNIANSYIRLKHTKDIQINGELQANTIIYNSEKTFNLGNSIVRNNTLINNSIREKSFVLKQTDGEFEFINNKLYGFNYLFSFDIQPKHVKIFSNIPIQLYKGYIPADSIEYVDGCLNKKNNNIGIYTNKIWNNLLLLNSLTERPENNFRGQYFFDNNLNIPIFWNGSKWINSSGNTAYLNKGDTSQRPTLTNADEGCEYYDNVLKKKILWNGIAWVNMDGTALQ